MIVLNNNKDAASAVEQKTVRHETTLEELFRKELDAYCAYKQLVEETEDPILEMALEEIMVDEYLHAKFLRDYLMDNEMYTPKSEDAYEQKFWRAYNHLFKN